jgi:HAE1 family hydrophobic/amphiphilic exporter-1
MDIYAIFGVFMLVGIVKKNGILQVDYTNELRRRGMDRDAAILQANRTRLRPILMTTLMLVAGMIPIALGQGPGSAARASLAKVIIGGQVLSLLPTLLVTPVSYALFDSLKARLGRGFGDRSEEDIGEESIDLHGYGNGNGNGHGHGDTPALPLNHPDDDRTLTTIA